MDIQNNGFLSIEQLTDRYLNNKKPVKESEAAGLSFQDILQQKRLLGAESLGELKFSRHASERLSSRSIELSEDQLKRLSDGARKAGQKGIRDSLVIVDELAFIVNVPNQTVVTAMDSTQTNENVFTNINGAVIM
ncbi:MAG: flagellar protein [Lachnospiraceae bacterium]|nr:flagellar protein [Lachnospiraceae bacterium]